MSSDVESLSDTELDDLLVSLLEPPSAPPSASDLPLPLPPRSPVSSSCETEDIDSFALTDLEKLASPPRAARKRGVGSRGVACGADAEAIRKQRRMANNRAAAATSRARKKAAMDDMMSKVHALETENERLRSCLLRHGLMGEIEEIEGGQGQQPLTAQPEVLPLMRDHNQLLSSAVATLLLISLAQPLVLSALALATREKAPAPGLARARLPRLPGAPSPAREACAHSCMDPDGVTDDVLWTRLKPPDPPRACVAACA